MFPSHFSCSQMDASQELSVLSHESLALHFQCDQNQSNGWWSFPQRSQLSIHEITLFNCHVVYGCLRTKVVQFTTRTGSLVVALRPAASHRASLWSSARQLEACLANNKHYDLHKLPTLDRIICLLGTGMLGLGLAILLHSISISISIYIYSMYVYAKDIQI